MQISLSSPELSTFFWNSRWRPPPSSIFRLCEFGQCSSHWDQHTYAPDVHLMTSRELTSGFDFWSRDHLHVTVTHLLMNSGARSGVIDIFPKFKVAAAAIMDFQVMWIWPFWRVDSLVLVFCTKFVSNIWDRRTYASDVHLMTSRELTSGFGFDSWSCDHLRMAVMHLP